MTQHTPQDSQSEIRKKLTCIMGGCVGSHEDCLYATIENAEVDSVEEMQQMVDMQISLIEAYVTTRVKEAVDNYHNEITADETKVWISRADFEQRLEEAERLARIDAAKDATQSAIYVLTGSDDFRIEPGVNLGLNVGQITKLRQTLYRMKDAYQAQALTTTTNGKEE